MSIKRLFKKGVKAVNGLHERECDANPFKQFERWFAEANETDLAYPEAMSLATASPDGAPAVRMVLMKQWDERGFCFFTNYESRKSDELIQNPRAALLFYWEPYERQVRIEGGIEKVSEEESEAYFRSRPRGSRIGAWASAQSGVIESREELEAQVKKYERQFGSGDIPLPPFWGGFRCVPDRFEFWQGRINRLHDRLVYVRDEDAWKRLRLAP